MLQEKEKSYLLKLARDSVLFYLNENKLLDVDSEIQEIFQNICDVKQVSTMREALEVSVSITRSGGTILLSPSCSSFDWYSSYAERGDDFRSLVHEYIGGNQSG